MTKSVELPGAARTIVSIFLVILTELAFAAFSLWAMIQTWVAAAGSIPRFSEPFAYFSTAIAALVGGIVAVGFGLKPPPGPSSGPGRLTRSLNGLSRLGISQVLLTIYVMVYLVCGVGAILTWVIRPPETPDIVKNLALAFMGMLIPVVTAYFS
jgi:hypothetical protein